MMSGSRETGFYKYRITPVLLQFLFDKKSTRLEYALIFPDKVKTLYLITAHKKNYTCFPMPQGGVLP